MSDWTWVIVPFDSKNQDRQQFHCGEPELDNYLRKYAGQHVKANLSRTFVAVLNHAPQRIIGFYSLSMAQVAFDEIPQEMSRKLPKYPIPVARLGRLAVDTNFQGKGIGAALLMNALARCAGIARQDIAANGVIVDAKHERAQRFYQKYGFITLTAKPLTLFIPMADIFESLPLRIA